MRVWVVAGMVGCVALVVGALVGVLAVAGAVCRGDADEVFREEGPRC